MEYYCVCPLRLLLMMRDFSPLTNHDCVISSTYSLIRVPSSPQSCSESIWEAMRSLRPLVLFNTETKSTIVRLAWVCKLGDPF